MGAVNLFVEEGGLDWLWGSEEVMGGVPRAWHFGHGRML